jgi:hypothetical protein
VSSLPISMTRALPADRVRDFALLFALVAWLVYTKMFWVLQAAHFVAPPCPFYAMTGHPCPFCGGTRSFAYMWRGDLADAVRLYPLGPVIFVGAVFGTAGLAFGALTGRTWTPRLSPLQWRLLGIGAVSALLLSWALKVFVLGN